MQKRDSQNTLILEALQDGPITPREALERFGCFRLAARIGELKEAGLPIQTEYICERNRYGEAVRFARYSIAKTYSGKAHA